MNQELKQVRGLVTGVPYFVFNKGQGDGEVHISGAQVRSQCTVCYLKQSKLISEHLLGLLQFPMKWD